MRGDGRCLAPAAARRPQRLVQFFQESFNQLNLTGMIDVVEGDAGNQPAHGGLASTSGMIQVFWPKCRNDFSQFLMLRFEKRHICPPCFFAPIDWPIEPITPSHCKGATFFANQSPSDRVFPIGGMDHDFPDVMTPAPRSEGRFTGRDTSNRATKVGPVPCRPFVSLIEQTQQMLDFRMCHRFSHRRANYRLRG